MGYKEYLAQMKQQQALSDYDRQLNQDQWFQNILTSTSILDTGGTYSCPAAQGLGQAALNNALVDKIAKESQTPDEKFKSFSRIKNGSKKLPKYQKKYKTRNR